jgi:WD40 repeat protein
MKVISQDGILSPNNLFLAYSHSGENDYETFTDIWSLADGKILFTLQGQVLAFSQDGSKVAIKHDLDLDFYQVATGKLLNTIKSIDFTSSYGFDERGRMALSPDWSNLITGDQMGNLIIYRVEDGQILHTIDATISDKLAFSPDGTFLASTSLWWWNPKNIVQFWRIPNGALLRQLDNANPIIGVAFSPDGNVLASFLLTPDRSWAMNVLLRQVSDGIVLNTLNVNKPDDMVFSPNGKILATTSALGIGVQLWQKENWSVPTTLANTRGIYRLAFSPDGTFLAGGSLDGKILLWRVEDLSLKRTLDIHIDGQRNDIFSIAFSPDGQVLAIASYDGKIRFWHVNNEYQQPVILNSEEEETTASFELAFSPDGLLLASRYGDLGIKIYRTSDGSLLSMLGTERPKSPQDSTISIITSDIAFSPDGTLLVAGSSQGVIRLWGIP